MLFGDISDESDVYVHSEAGCELRVPLSYN